MPWIIMSDDRPELRHLRDDAELMKAHTDWEESIIGKIVAAGSTRSEDGEVPTGGLLILDVQTRDEAEAIFEQDPFVRAGLRCNVAYRRWFKAILDGRIRY